MDLAPAGPGLTTWWRRKFCNGDEWEALNDIASGFMGECVVVSCFSDTEPKIICFSFHSSKFSIPMNGRKY